MRQLGGFKFSRQIPVAPFVCDFVCRERMLVVEIDGGQHGERAAKDARRTTYLEEHGLTVVRFWNDEVMSNVEGVLQVILSTLQSLSSKFANSPLPLAGGEEPRTGEGVGANWSHSPTPQPPPASGRGSR
jgi:very-short-patch-repair endonuclease